VHVFKDLLTRLGRSVIAGLLALLAKAADKTSAQQCGRRALLVLFDREGQKALRVYLLLAPDHQIARLDEMAGQVLESLRESKAA
jgi:hypothetical protein